MARSRTLLLLSGSLLLVLGMLWGQWGSSAIATPPPTVGTPVVQPPSFLVHRPTLLTVTSQITTSPDNAVVPASVELERVSARGAIVAPLGTMYDDGTHGDAVAGDGIFTVQVSFTEAFPGTLRLQASALFANWPGQITSAVALVPISANTPPVAHP